MTRKRAKTGARHGNGNTVKNAARLQLPNEVLLEIWDRVPPLERVSISQVCRKWRSMALSTPRFWTRLALVSTMHEAACHRIQHSSVANRYSHDFYNPRRNSNNLVFADELFLRSRELPLDVTIDGNGCPDCYDRDLYNALGPHRSRIARIHFSTGNGYSFGFLLGFRGHLPSLRTLTAGFDDCEVEYADLPVSLPEGTSLPLLRQIHLGAGAQEGFIDWRHLSLPSVRELTMTPARMDFTPLAVSCCKNLSRMTIVMTQLSVQNILAMHLIPFLDALATVPEICLSEISVSQEKFIVLHFNEAHFRHLTLDYVGRARRPGSTWYFSLASPCDVLTDPVRLTLTLRESVYEIAAVDAVGIRREILLDYATIHMAPGLWDYYLRTKAIASATVDAVAWRYFADGMPDELCIEALTIVVLHDGEELQKVSLAAFGILQKLHIDSIKSSVKFNITTLLRLLRSRSKKTKANSLLTLTLNPIVALRNADRNSFSEVCKIID